MTALTEFVELKRRGRVAVITVNNPPNNVLSHGVRKGLKDGVVAASGDPAVSAMVITCAGRTFIAGGDTTEFVRPPQEPGLHEVLDLIEESSKPGVAAIHGTALLGGFEVILACHYRVSVRTARCGLPGVTMGLLPGAGGTQRLPRHPRQPPPEQLQPCRLPVPSHPSCPCAAVRAGGLSAASSAGQPLARGVRADPRRGQQRAGWQQGGMGWADAVGGKGRLIFLSPNRHERHANSIPTEHGHPTATCFALGSDLTSTDRCRPHPTNWRRRCRSYAGSGGCSRERSGRVWLSKISSSPSRNGPASPPTGLSIIVSPR